MNRSILRATLLGLAWAGAALAQAGGGAPAKPAPPASQDPRPAVRLGDTLPEDVRLTDTAGKAFSFAEARGRVVAIHFWSTSCPWEKAAEPKLMQLAKDFEGKDVVFVAVACNQDEIGEQPKPEAFAAEDPAARPYGKLRAKAERVRFNHRILIDHGGDVARLLAAKSTPHCFVVDKTGVLVYSGALDDNGRGEAKRQYLREAVEAALAGKKVETATTRPYG